MFCSRVRLDPLATAKCLHPLFVWVIVLLAALSLTRVICLFADMEIVLADAEEKLPDI